MIKLLLTDVDGVLTDGGVYYSENGEQLKKFSIRDGMGVERLRKIAGIETGIITGEKSGSVVKRAEKLNITELHLGIKDKGSLLEEILKRKNLLATEVAFIGDDVNDIEILNIASEKDLKAIFKRSYPKIIMSSQKYFDTDNPSIKNNRQI